MSVAILENLENLRIKEKELKRTRDGGYAPATAHCQFLEVPSVEIQRSQRTRDGGYAPATANDELIEVPSIYF
ncbi:MAG: hypothetical protein Q6K90_01440, partial [Gloeomargarita sp. HHBFW_bins_162]